MWQLPGRCGDEGLALYDTPGAHWLMWAFRRFAAAERGGTGRAAERSPRRSITTQRTATFASPRPIPNCRACPWTSRLWRARCRACCWEKRCCVCWSGVSRCARGWGTSHALCRGPIAGTEGVSLQHHCTRRHLLPARHLFPQHLALSPVCLGLRRPALRLPRPASARSPGEAARKGGVEQGCLYVCVGPHCCCPPAPGPARRPAGQHQLGKRADR